MVISLAKEGDLSSIHQIVQETIKAVYPSFYAKGAVDFFLSHHNNEALLEDIKANNVFLIKHQLEIVGTISINNNEINRWFVLPSFQGLGYGKALIDFAEERILKNYSYITLSSSIPAKKIYEKRNYKVVDHKVIINNNDPLPYDIMEKHSK